MILHVAAVFKICLYVVEISGFKSLGAQRELHALPNRGRAFTGSQTQAQPRNVPSVGRAAESAIAPHHAAR